MEKGKAKNTKCYNAKLYLSHWEAISISIGKFLLFQRLENTLNILWLENCPPEGKLISSKIWSPYIALDQVLPPPRQWFALIVISFKFISSPLYLLDLTCRYLAGWFFDKGCSSPPCLVIFGPDLQIFGRGLSEGCSKSNPPSCLASTADLLAGTPSLVYPPHTLIQSWSGFDDDVIIKT